MSFIEPIIRANLRRLILLLTIGSVLLTLGNSYIAIYNEQKRLIIDATLESNRRYAAKIASSAESLLTTGQREIAYASVLLSEQRMAPTQLEREVHRVVNQSDLFNSAVIVDRHAEVAAIWPSNIVPKGYLLPESTRQSFYAKDPLITDPFHSVSGNTLISISHPIWGDGGRYLGYISGTVYLNENGALANLMRNHFFEDDTYLYVVDRHGELIFHADPERIGENVSFMPFIQQVAAGGSGAREVTNSKEVEMITGYAPIKSAQWGVVVQRPKDRVMETINEQVMRVFWRTMPVVILTLVGIWLLSLLITRPLRQLAEGVVNPNDEHEQKKILSVNAWYYEAAQLKNAILHGLGLLNDRIHELDIDSHTDPLTHLYNRRGMQRVLDAFEASHTQFSVLALDIDHFKDVNDRYGHDVGDRVIQELAEILKKYSPDHSHHCRVGGEEFLIFLEQTPLDRAINIAQSLAERISATDIQTVGHVTVSIGVSCTQGDTAMRDIDVAIKQADTALYEAKNMGRNCVRWTHLDTQSRL